MNALPVTCPGCGVSLPANPSYPLSRFHASRECWHLYGELAAYTLSLGDKEFIHQHAVDAYEAQHSGPETKNITAVFGLIGLYLVLEKGYTGRQVQQAHIVMANKNKTWPRFDSPTVKWSMTVMDVLRSREGTDRCASIIEWAHAVWNGWEKDQQTIRTLAGIYLFA